MVFGLVGWFVQFLTLLSVTGLKKTNPKHLTPVWIPPRLSHSLYHTSALLEGNRKASLVMVFPSFTLYIGRTERVTPDSVAVAFKKTFPTEP